MREGPSVFIPRSLVLLSWAAVPFHTALAVTKAPPACGLSLFSELQSVCVWLQPWCGLVAEYAPADAKGSTAFLRREPPLPHPRRSLCLVATVSCGLGLQPTVLWPDGFCMTATSQQGPPLTRARAWHWDSPGDQPQGDPSTRPAVAMTRVSFASGHFGDSQRLQQITDLQTPPKRTWEPPQAVWQHLPSETCTYQE